MYHVYNSFHIVNRRMLQNAMSEVENVTGSAVRTPQYIMHARFEFRQRCKECNRIEVPLNGDVAQSVPSLAQIDPLATTIWKWLYDYDAVAGGRAETVAPDKRGLRKVAIERLGLPAAR